MSGRAFVAFVGLLGVLSGAGWISICCAPSPLAAQEPTEVSGRQEVTAVDVLVGFKNTGVVIAGNDDPARVGPDDFEILRDGEVLPIVGFGAPDGRDGLGGETASEPWHSVIYFDAVLNTTEALRWAADELASRVDSLVALGTVEILLADPEPRRALAPTRDPALVEATLTDLRLNARASADLLALRAAFLEEAGLGNSDAEIEEMRQAAAVEEFLMVRSQLDGLLARLLATDVAGPRRALFLAGHGFDLNPEPFYETGDPPTGSAALEAGMPGGRLAEVADAFARALAGYSWTTVHLLAPAPEPPPKKWNAKRKLEVRIDGNWDPKLAEAQLELAQSRLAQGEFGLAEEAFRDAIYRFYGDPKLRQREARANLGLARALRFLDREEEALWVEREAVRLDPALVESVPALAARILAPESSIAVWVEDTGGFLVRQSADLDDALTDLALRRRLTVQVAGEADGLSHPLEVRLRRRGFEARAPRWLRSGTPQVAAELSLRQLLDGELDQGDLAIDVRFEPQRRTETQIEGTLRVEIVLDPESPVLDQGRRVVVRVSVGSAGPTGDFVAEHFLLPAEETVGSGPWRSERQITLPQDHDWLAVRVEELTSETAGSAFVELAGQISAIS